MASSCFIRTPTIPTLEQRCRAHRRPLWVKSRLRAAKNHFPFIPKADTFVANRNVRFGPRADIATQLPVGLVRVNFDNCLPRRSSRALIVGGQYRAELSGIFAASRRSHGTHLLQWNSTLGN